MNNIFNNDLAFTYIGATGSQTESTQNWHSSPKVAQIATAGYYLIIVLVRATSGTVLFSGASYELGGYAAGEIFVGIKQYSAGTNIKAYWYGSGTVDYWVHCYKLPMH